MSSTPWLYGSCRYTHSGGRGISLHACACRRFCEWWCLLDTIQKNKMTKHQRSGCQNNKAFSSLAGMSWVFPVIKGSWVPRLNSWRVKTEDRWTQAMKRVTWSTEAGQMQAEMRPTLQTSVRRRVVGSILGVFRLTCNAVGYMRVYVRAFSFQHLSKTSGPSIKGTFLRDRVIRKLVKGRGQWCAT